MSLVLGLSAFLDAAVAELLAAGAVVGWVQGRLEFGPRALGARSILADPRGPGVQARVNREMKRREGFRPFAPAVLAEAAADWFHVDRPAPFMTRTAPARGFTGATPPPGAPLSGPWTVHAPLPAVTHVDGSARLQTVSADVHPRFHALIAAFARRTGVPVLLNTSFNLRGEPIVATADDACRTFAASGLHALALGDALIRRDAQPPEVLRAIDAPLTRPD